jgi:hypothetical protein
MQQRELSGAALGAAAQKIVQEFDQASSGRDKTVRLQCSTCRNPGDHEPSLCNGVVNLSLE